jgi:hypothetical protein
MKNSNKKMISSSSVSKLKSTLIFILIYLECNLRVTALMAPSTATSNIHHRQNHHNIRHSRHLMLKDKHEQRLLHTINLFKLSNNSITNGKVASNQKHRFNNHKTTTTTLPTYFDDLDFDNFGSYKGDNYQLARQKHLQRIFDSHEDDDVRSARTYNQKRQPTSRSKYFDRRQETKPPYRPFKRYDYNYNFDSTATTTIMPRNFAKSQHKMKKPSHFGDSDSKKPNLQTKSLYGSRSSLDDMVYDYLDEEEYDERDNRSPNNNFKNKVSLI